MSTKGHAAKQERKQRPYPILTAPSELLAQIWIFKVCQTAFTSSKLL